MGSILFHDGFYRECISLAKKSKGKHERYGALLVKHNEIFGRGYNRAIAHPAWEKSLERIIRQGHTNHAEIEALNDALMNYEIDVNGSNIYVAGFFYPTSQLFFQDKFTCVKCPKYLLKYGIENIFIPSINGWKKRPVNKALIEAKEYLVGGTTNNRIKSCQGKYFLNDLF